MVKFTSAVISKIGKELRTLWTTLCKNVKTTILNTRVRTICAGLVAIMLAATIAPSTISMAETNDTTNGGSEVSQVASSISDGKSISYAGYTGISKTVGQVTYTTVKSNQLTINFLGIILLRLIR